VAVPPIAEEMLLSIHIQ